MAATTAADFFIGDKVAVRGLSGYWWVSSQVYSRGRISIRNTPPSSSGYTETTVRVSDLTLVSRGNEFRLQNGQPLEFENAGEEAGFWKRHDKAHDLPNPTTGLYVWTVEEAVRALEAGLADAFFWVSGPVLIPGVDPTLTAMKFDDPEVAARMRAESLQRLRETFRI